MKDPVLNPNTPNPSPASPAPTNLHPDPVVIADRTSAEARAADERAANARAAADARLFDPRYPEAPYPRVPLANARAKFTVVSVADVPGNSRDPATKTVVLSAVIGSEENKNLFGVPADITLSALTPEAAALFVYGRAVFVDFALD